MGTDLIQETRNKLAKLTDKLTAIDEVSAELRQLVEVDQSLPSHAVRQAASLQMLRDLLTPDVMAPVMALMGSTLGFKTDKDSYGEPYGVDVVRDVMITCAGRGGQMTLNHTNIISGNYYATKWQFGTWLDAKQGRGNWLVIHGLPKIIRGEKMVKNKQTQQYEKKTNVVLGATLASEVRWVDGDAWKSETLTHALKGDDYSTSDAFNGKADRKCRAWLWGQITGKHIGDGDIDELSVTPNGPEKGEPVTRIQDTSDLTVKATVVEPAKPTPAKPKAPAEPKPPQTPASPPTDSDLAKACNVPITLFRDYVKAKGFTLTDHARCEILAEPKVTAEAINAWADAE